MTSRWGSRARGGAGAAVLATVLALAAGCGGDDEAASSSAVEAAAGTTASADTAAGTEGATSAAARSEPAELKIWYLGDAEAPGFESWMQESIEQYQSANPDVTVQAEVKGVDTWLATQATACQSKNGPDIWYQWAGGYAMEQAWNGCTIAANDVWPQSEIDNLTNLEEGTWQGKVWWFPQFLQVFPIVYNKDLFAKAGLDPEAPPKDWDTFLKHLEALDGAGITPFALGLKDGWGGEIASNFFIKQVFDDWDELKQRVVDGRFDDEAWQSWLERVEEIKPYFNDDVASIPFAQALARFAKGDVAMVFGSPGVNATIADLSSKGTKVGVMEMPVFGDSELADSFSTGASGFAITSWSEQQQQAGAFLQFLHSPERLSAWFEATNNFPADKRFDGSQVTQPQLKQIYDWVQEKNGVYPNSFVPVQLDVEGNFAAWQGLFAGTLDAKEAAALYQSVIEKWRTTNAGVIENWKIWASG